MNKPKALSDLVSRLKGQGPSTSVVSVRHSQAIVIVPDDPEGLILDAEDCEILFDSTDTVDQFWEAINRPDAATLELQNIGLEDDVLEKLTELFDSVDEF